MRNLWKLFSGSRGVCVQQLPSDQQRDSKGGLQESKIPNSPRRTLEEDV